MYGENNTNVNCNKHDLYFVFAYFYDTYDLKTQTKL